MRRKPAERSDNEMPETLREVADGLEAVAQYLRMVAEGMQRGSVEMIRIQHGPEARKRLGTTFRKFATEAQHAAAKKGAKFPPGPPQGDAFPPGPWPELPLPPAEKTGP